MSEHRCGFTDAPTILHSSSIEEAETAAFVDRFIEQVTPRAEHRRKYIDGGHLGIESLLRLQAEELDDLTVLWAGLPPTIADEFVGRLALRWRALLALMERNAARAETMRAKRGQCDGTKAGA